MKAEYASKTMATQPNSTQHQHPKIGPTSKGEVHYKTAANTK
jgi:hypothetical protein